MIPLKSQKELQMLKRSGRILADVLQKVQRIVRPGITTSDIDRLSEELILKEASEVALIRYAKSQEMVSMQGDGILKAITGVTTFDEVVSVTGPIEWPAENKK